MRNETDTQQPPAEIGDLLVECHRRIRKFAAMALRLGEVHEAPEHQIADAAHRVRRFFEQALPLHVEDEEQSVLPRLRGRDRTLDEHLQQMSAEHRSHEPLVDPLVATCRLLERSPEHHAARREELFAAASALERELEAHMRQEEELIIPAIARWVEPADRAKMVDELRERRTSGGSPDRSAARENAATSAADH